MHLAASVGGLAGAQVSFGPQYEYYRRGHGGGGREILSDDAGDSWRITKVCGVRVYFWKTAFREEEPGA